ncbi:ABC transporter ATP-binding protein [Dellaglioa sp. BT-FLS60]
MGNILIIKNVSKQYGKKSVLKNINLTINESKIIGLIGPNGAGKSTLMKIILGLTAIKQGDILVNGISITTRNHEGLTGVGSLIEYPEIYPFLTGFEHLRLYSGTNNFEDVVKELKMTGYINKPAKDYSLGMKQKLGIAMALINNPNFIILDEPMNGLDPIATKDLRNLILGLKSKGKTILISSHILSELEKIADDVILMDQGKVVLQSSITDLEAHTTKTYVLKVNHLNKAFSELKHNNFDVNIETDSIKFTTNESGTLNNIIKVLVDNGLILEEISTVESDLETALLEILSKQGAFK